MKEKKKYFISQVLMLVYGMSVRKYDIWKSKTWIFLRKCQLTLQKFFDFSPQQTVTLFYRNKNDEVTATSGDEMVLLPCLKSMGYKSANAATTSHEPFYVLLPVDQVT